MIGDVKKAHVLAEFQCIVCSGTCLRLTVAPVVDGQIQSPAETPSGDVICNDCQKVRQDREATEYYKAIARRKWAKKHGIKPPRVNRPRGGA